MRIVRIRATEVIVPAKPGTINSASLDRPLHKLDSGGQKAWTRQFDEFPKLLLQLELDNGIVGLGECYRDHDWRIIGDIVRTLLGQPLTVFKRQDRLRSAASMTALNVPFGMRSPAPINCRWWNC